MAARLFVWRKIIGKLDDGEAAVGAEFERGRVKAEIFAAPPVAGLAFFLSCGEPILPKHGANLLGRSIGKGIRGKQRKDIEIVCKKVALSAEDHGIVAPVAERCEPEIPIEARLVGSVNAGSFVEGLGLVGEGIGSPVDAVVRALKFDFVAAAGHDGEKAVTIGDAERIEKRNGRSWEINRGKHPNNLDGGGVENPGEHHGGDGDAQWREGAAGGIEPGRWSGG